jgi:ABC-2 type transport system ATP-binding protein
MIEVDHLTKSYGAHRAVDDLSFRVDKGEVVGFLGPNGAGKSTTLRILAGFLGATSGVVTINGFNVADDAMKARASIGYMPETSPLYPEMRVGEYLRFRAELKLVPRSKRAEAVARALADARVEDVADQSIGHLSKGYRQRVGLADALVASPPLLILDEPTAGLDPNQIREVRDLIKRLGKDRTILLSTHILSEVEATCTRAVVITKGRLVAEGTIEEIRKQRGERRVRVVARGDVDAAIPAVEELAGVVSAKVSELHDDVRAIEVEVRAQGDEASDAEHVAERVVTTLVGAGVLVREVTSATSLERIFSELTEPAPAPKKKAARSEERA